MYSFFFKFLKSQCTFTGPVSAGDTTPRPGIPSPSSLSSPDVEVGSTCYEVNLFESVTMSCADTKKETALQYGGWERLVNGTWTNVVQTTSKFSSFVLLHSVSCLFQEFFTYIKWSVIVMGATWDQIKLLMIHTVTNIPDLSEFIHS